MTAMSSQQNRPDPNNPYIKYQEEVIAKRARKREEQRQQKEAEEAEKARQKELAEREAPKWTDEDEKKATGQMEADPALSELVAERDIERSLSNLSLDNSFEERMPNVAGFGHRKRKPRAGFARPGQDQADSGEPLAEIGSKESVTRDSPVEHPQR